MVTPEAKELALSLGIDPETLSLVPSKQVQANSYTAAAASGLYLNASKSDQMEIVRKTQLDF